MRCTLLFSAAISFACDARPINIVELAGAPSSPTANECLAVSKYNHQILHELITQHQQCLEQHEASSGGYQLANPCAKRECRPIHIQMDKTSKAIDAIDKSCKVTNSRSTTETEVIAGSNAIPAIRDAQQLYSYGKTTIDILHMRDRPVPMAARAWGKSAKYVRQKLAGIVTGNSTTSDPDWMLYDLLFNKAYKSNAEIAYRSGNPVAGAIGEAMLSKLYVMDAKLMSEMQGAISSMNEISSDLANYHGKNITSVPSPSPRSQNSTSSAVREECAILQDVDRSRSLQGSDPTRWNSLQSECLN